MVQQFEWVFGAGLLLLLLHRLADTPPPNVFRQYDLGSLDARLSVQVNVQILDKQLLLEYFASSLAKSARYFPQTIGLQLVELVHLSQSKAPGKRFIASASSDGREGSYHFRILEDRRRGWWAGAWCASRKRWQKINVVGQGCHRHGHGEWVNLT